MRRPTSVLRRKKKSTTSVPEPASEEPADRGPDITMVSDYGSIDRLG